MPYKDKDKQREAIRAATRRYRTKVSQGITEVSQDKVSPVIPDVRPGCTGCKLMSNNGRGLACPRGEFSSFIVSVFEQAVNPERDCEES